MPVFSYDTETFLMVPGCQAPPMVCFQFAVDGGPGEIIHARDPALPGIVRDALTKYTVNGHNLAYDMGVLAAWDPDLLPLIFDCYEGNRATCTAVRHKLIDIAHGCFEGDGKGRPWGYSLAECLERATSQTLDKTDPWRMKYGTLYQTLAISEWPEEARRYALLDVRAQQELYWAQQDLGAGGLLEDEFRQSRAAWVLHLARCWGMVTDLPAVQAYHAQVLEASDRDQAIAVAAGLVRDNGTRDMKAAKARMLAIMRDLGDLPTLTKTGLKKAREGLAPREPIPPGRIWELAEEYISLDEDACLASGDETLAAFQRFGSQKTILTRVERLYKGTEVPLQASFQSLVETGRTSCRIGEVKPGESPPAWGFQLQNLPREKGLRECFRPRPGFVYCSVDYDGMELRTWAQCCLWIINRSKLAQVLNEGLDPHTELAATLAHVPAQEAYAILKGAKGQEAKDSLKNFRQLAKIANFGMMGGMGAPTFRTHARVSSRGKVLLSEEESRDICMGWHRTWPEAQGYFAWISDMLEKGNGRAIVRHFQANRVRLVNKYSVCCNTFFQGLCADAAKAAGWQLAKECYLDTRSPLYGSRIVNFIHDEYILEVPAEPERAHLAAMRQAQVMRDVAQTWVPDVRVTCSPTLMARWSKDAEPVWQGDMLVAWPPTQDVSSQAA